MRERERERERERDRHTQTHRQTDRHTDSNHTDSRLKSQPHGSNHSLEAQIPLLMLKFNPRASKLTKHRSSAPLGPLPLSPSHTYIYSHRGKGYR